MGESGARGRTRAARFRAASLLRLLDYWIYAGFAGVCTLAVARLFYGSMRSQLTTTGAGMPRSLAEWSAPLDDVFIHFDVARATARGHPLEWCEGNGYSSGGTSLLYPLVLAFGYWVGFRALRLMLWAAIVACVSVLATLLATRRLFRGLPPAAAYFGPLVFLSVGALDWSLFSGMEIALFMALWGAALASWDELVNGEPAGGSSGWRALGLGLWSMTLVATRPEAVVIAALFAIWVGVVHARRAGLRTGLVVLLAAGLPAALFVAAQALVNLALTGDAAAAGALVKLEIYNPRMTGAEVLEKYWFHLRYQLLRITQYHLSDSAYLGWIPWALALAALAMKPTRRAASLLLGSTLGWALVVALNGQVRWQNERYAMPALAWMLLCAALGLGGLLSRAFDATPKRRALRIAGALAAVTALGVFLLHERPRMREQAWFFGRASRNIRDQHLWTGTQLRMLPTAPRRIGVGDAGAIPYAADLPALDMIGLGGYRHLPFARATRWSIGAMLELLERVPKVDRPDYLALYPSWWDRVPIWFGRRLGEVAVTGNVICAGPAKVLYAADWSPLDRGEQPATLHAGERVVDSVDFADLVSEQAHRWAFDPPAIPLVEMKLLPDPREPRVDLWDAGRTLQPGERDRVVLNGLVAGHPLRLVARAAPAASADIEVAIDGAPAGVLRVEPADAWVELSLEVAPQRVKERLSVELCGRRGERILHHLWAVQR